MHNDECNIASQRHGLQSLANTANTLRRIQWVVCERIALNVRHHRAKGK